MTQSKSSGTQNKQSDNQSEQDVAKQRAGKDKSSHDDTSRVNAETGKGAGGGAKQKQNH